MWIFRTTCLLEKGVSILHIFHKFTHKPFRFRLGKNKGFYGYLFIECLKHIIIQIFPFFISNLTSGKSFPVFLSRAFKKTLLSNRLYDLPLNSAFSRIIFFFFIFTKTGMWSLRFHGSVPAYCMLVQFKKIRSIVASLCKGTILN